MIIVCRYVYLGTSAGIKSRVCLDNNCSTDSDNNNHAVITVISILLEAEFFSQFRQQSLCIIYIKLQLLWNENYFAVIFS